jgi:hypothetical protein
MMLEQERTLEKSRTHGADHEQDPRYVCNTIRYHR